jgi:hypothetical protein
VADQIGELITVARATGFDLVPRRFLSAPERDSETILAATMSGVWNIAAGGHDVLRLQHRRCELRQAANYELGSR